MAEARHEIPSVYDPKQVEDRWYRFWEEGGYFRGEVDRDRTPFCIVIPPPNVTGRLHIGHAWDNTIQDVLIRFHRMRGDAAVWIPGTDHAGLATQIKVEEELRKREALSRHDLGREKFVERVWDWKAKYGSAILNQLKRLGASCDWRRERFTMDEGCSRAVREVFVRLYQKGLIYKGTYMVNWCPHCNTALSDIEVIHEEQNGKLWHIRYPAEDGGPGVVVATTRPETMLGDTAVAVNPGDGRYRHLIGKAVVLPIVGRRLPIVADEHVDPAFGTGAVKVTPAHDPNDYEMGLRHRLDSVEVIGRDGRMTEAAGSKYVGMDRYECRQALVQDLAAGGNLVEIKDHAHAVGTCQRCENVVEPLVSTQWFVRMKPLAEPAARAVEDGRTRIIPERFAKVYLHWLENIRDWCISRQIWWGHRIPAWYCPDGHITVAEEAPERCEKCGSGKLSQDEDALDTWFSSALWPFSTLGWPNKTPELDFWYPTSTLVTGYDILFFWVARMMFMGLEHQSQVPFRDVLLHGLVRDAEGRKVSKSLGNGIDPLEVIDKYGADALRCTLLSGNAPGNDQRFSWERVEVSRNFANKLWNASRFALMNLKDFGGASAGGESPLDMLEVEDRWILTRLGAAVDQATELLDRYELGEALRVVYDFIWDELCDWYIELIKPRLYGETSAAGSGVKADGSPTAGSRRAAQAALRYVLDQTLRLLHPFMPFITEAIWQALPHQGDALIRAGWPKASDELRFPTAAKQVALAQEVIRAVRNLRAEVNVPPGRKADLALRPLDPAAREAVAATVHHIRRLGGIAELSLLGPADGKPDQAATAVAGGTEVYLPLRGLIDAGAELTRLRKEAAATAEELEKLRGRLNNPGFVAKAPPTVVAKDRAGAEELERKAAALASQIDLLAAL